MLVTINPSRLKERETNVCVCVHNHAIFFHCDRRKEKKENKSMQFSTHFSIVVNYKDFSFSLSLSAVAGNFFCHIWRTSEEKKRTLIRVEKCLLFATREGILISPTAFDIEREFLQSHFQVVKYSLSRVL